MFIELITLNFVIIIIIIMISIINWNFKNHIPLPGTLICDIQHPDVDFAINLVIYIYITYKSSNNL